MYSDMHPPMENHTIQFHCPKNSFSKGFPDGSDGKESACNTGDLGLIPGLGRSSGEGTGYPLQYSWASLVAKMVENPPVMQETWARSWVGKIPWRRAWQHTPVFCLENPHGQRSLTGYGLWVSKQLDTTE